MVSSKPFIFSHIYNSKFKAMKEFTTPIDLVEIGRRFKLVRQKLKMTQTDVGKQINTSQLMIHRVEKGLTTRYGILLDLMMFYSTYVHVSVFFAEKFNIDSIELFDNREIQTLFNTTLTMLRYEIDQKLNDLHESVAEKMGNLQDAVDKMPN